MKKIAIVLMTALMVTMFAVCAPAMASNAITFPDIGGLLGVEGTLALQNFSTTGKNYQDVWTWNIPEGWTNNLACQTLISTAVCQYGWSAVYTVQVDLGLYKLTNDQGDEVAVVPNPDKSYISVYVPAGSTFVPVESWDAPDAIPAPRAVCNYCNGTGRNTTSLGGLLCYACNGTGKLSGASGWDTDPSIGSDADGSGLGIEIYEEACQVCNGSGKCAQCHGSGTTWYGGYEVSCNPDCTNCSGTGVKTRWRIKTN